MPERPESARPQWRERRSFPRPPLWLNLLLLALAAATFAFAKHQRNVLDVKTALLFKPSENSPQELNRMRDELARVDLTGAQLSRELDGRMKYLESLQGADFFGDIAVATDIENIIGVQGGTSTVRFSRMARPETPPRSGSASPSWARGSRLAAATMTWLSLAGSGTPMQTTG